MMVKMIVKGSLNKSSNTDKNECCISKTSVPVLARISPFLFSEKKEMGRFTVFLYNSFRISFKTPFLKNVIAYIARYLNIFFNKNKTITKEITNIKALDASSWANS
jgi:hypothetical protein